ECARTLQAEARNFLRRKDWQPRPKAWCAIGGRGVVLRRVTVPSISGEALQSVLALRIESEFPLPPEDLAWGFLQTSAPEGASQEVLIAAVRRQVIEEYHELLTGCGLNPQFTLASLARSHLCPSPGEPSCLLDLGGEHSELLCVD